MLQEKKPSKPDLSIGGFEIWVYGRQFPESDEYWDGNWLDIQARCSGKNATVEAFGSILHLTELQQLLNECKQIYATLEGEAHLNCMEPNLGLKITMERRGRCELFVTITPDHLIQEHSFTFDIDQSYLTSFIEDLEKILHSYPIKGTYS